MFTESIYWCDPCFWIYVAIVVVALYGLALFLWWWNKCGKASEVYIYFTLLLASEAFYNFFNALSRYYRTNDEDPTDFFNLLNHPIWRIRAFIHLCILFAIMASMTWRIIKLYRRGERGL